jgi:hypothetical protein
VPDLIIAPENFTWSTQNCGLKTLLGVDIEDLFPSTECDTTTNSIQILGYRDEDTFYASDLSGKRPIYFDEI